MRAATCMCAAPRMVPPPASNTPARAAPSVRVLPGAGRERGFQHPLLPAAVEPKQLVAPPHAHALAAGRSGVKGSRQERCASGARQPVAVAAAPPHARALPAM